MTATMEIFDRIDELGYAVRLLSDLSAATTPEAAIRVEAELAGAGATIATTAVL